MAKQKQKKVDLDLNDAPVAQAPVTADIYHVFVLDKSGSMSSTRKQTLDGINTSIEGIKEDATNTPDIEHHFSLITFSDPDKIELVFWNKPIDEINKMSPEDYVPGGGTALLDAIGTTITRIETDKEIAPKIKEKTAQVLLTVLTDGEENVSKEYKFDQIQDKVKGLQDDKENGWTVTYIGASPQTMATATSMGFAMTNTQVYDSSAVGTQSMYDNLKVARSSYSMSSAKGLKKCSADFFSPDLSKNDNSSVVDPDANSNINPTTTTPNVEPPIAKVEPPNTP